MIRFAQHLILAFSIAICALVAPQARADATVLEVIPLKHRTADDVIPIVRPFLDKQGAVSGMQGQLIIRTTPANLREIKELLATIDTAPRQLRITVKQNVDRATEQRLAEISGSVSAGERARVTVTPGSGGTEGLTVERRRGEDVLRGRVLDTQSTEDDRNTQHVQVLEGSQAFIRIGQSIPVPQATVIQGPAGAQVIEAVQYRDVTTGFYVLPRVAGDRVTLEISPQREMPGTLGPGSVNVQQASSVVSGRLGEWIDMGGLGQERSEQSSAIGSRTTTTISDQRKILIKVEEVR